MDIRPPSCLPMTPSPTTRGFEKEVMGLALGKVRKKKEKKKERAIEKKRERQIEEEGRR